jgi:hypothetical protein
MAEQYAIIDTRTSRDLCDCASIAGEIAIAIKYAGHGLGEAYEIGHQAPSRIIRDLRWAQHALGRLIAELEQINARS